MPSQSFQGKKFKLLRQVKDFVEHVVGVDDSKVPPGLNNKGFLLKNA